MNNQGDLYDSGRLARASQIHCSFYSFTSIGGVRFSRVLLCKLWVMSSRKYIFHFLIRFLTMLSLSFVYLLPRVSKNLVKQDGKKGHPVRVNEKGGKPNYPYPNVGIKNHDLCQWFAFHPLWKKKIVQLPQNVNKNSCTAVLDKVTPMDLMWFPTKWLHYPFLFVPIIKCPCSFSRFFF